MPNPFPYARVQAAMNVPTAYRRRMTFTFSRSGQTFDLEPISGSLTQDARRDGRWDGRLSFAGDALLPGSPQDILTPFGTRLQVYLGLELIDGNMAQVPYGSYEVTSAKTNETASSRTVDVGLGDISGLMNRYRFETPFTVATGTTLADMINLVAINRLGTNPGTPATSSTLGAARTFGLDTETGPWAEIIDVCSSFSKTAWYDRTGHLQLGSINPDPTASYPLPPIASLSADFSTKPPNVIVARGEAQDGTVPVQAVAMDDDPSSPTYAGTGPGTSPYGRVTQFYSSPLLLTAGQAQSAANTILADNLGAGAAYTITLPYDPTVTAGDVVSFEGTTYVVDAISLDITGDTTLQIRELA